MFDDPVAYERFMGRWSRRLADVFLDFAAIGDQGRVLDVGVGTGVLSRSLHERCVDCQITGIDVSPGFVKYAQDHCVGRFEVGDAQDLRFEDLSFDAALSLLVFTFVPDPVLAASEMARVTQPGGVVAATVWDLTGGMRMLCLFWEALVALDPSFADRSEDRMPMARSGGLADCWRQAGLQSVEEISLTIEMPFESFDDYWEPFLLGIGPAGSLLRTLSSDFQQVMREEIRSRIDVEDVHSPFVLPAKAWAVKGRAA